MNNITRLLAKNQLKQNRKRTIITIIGIVLSVSMLTAVCGFAVSGIEALRNLVGDDDVTAYQGAFISMATVLGVIIMIASIVVISNAFRVSASERTRQFGILKSVGATKQQIVKTVMYEAPAAICYCHSVRRWHGIAHPVAGYEHRRYVAGSPERDG